MIAQPLSATPAAEEGRCSTHPDRSLLGACTRCGAFYCAEDHQVLHGKAYCTACAARPEVDYLEGLRLEFWGKRDAWAWLVGFGALLNVLGGLASFATDDENAALVGIVSLAGAGVGVAFWLGVAWARLALVFVPIVSMIVGMVVVGPQRLFTGLVALIIVLIIFNDTRNRLFFKEEVSREALEKAWNLYKNNPVARGGVWAGALGLLIPGVCFVALICSIIGLRRVDPSAHPPLGRRKQAIAGIVLGGLGLVTTGAWVVFVLLDMKL